MNLEDIAASVPNGLHDLFVDRLSIDFAGGVATLNVSVWTGDLDSSSESERDAYRPALLVLEGLQFCIFNPPDPRYPYAEPRAIWLVDLLDADPEVSGRYVLPPGAFASRFFVDPRNAFIHVAALRATSTWK